MKAGSQTSMAPLRIVAYCILGLILLVLSQAGNPAGPPAAAAPQNAPPTIEGLPDIEIEEDTSRDNLVDLWTFSNDPETPSSQLSYTFVETVPPEFGISIDGNRYIDVEPAVNWFGSVEVGIEVSDGLGMDQDFFIVTVEGVNDAPMLREISQFEAGIDTPIEVDLKPYIDDVDNLWFELTPVVDFPEHAYVNVDGLVLTCTPDTGFEGRETVRVWISDDAGASSRAVDLILVWTHTPNQRPQIVGLPLKIFQDIGIPVLFDFTNYGLDAEDVPQNLRWYVEETGKNVSVRRLSDSTFRFSPEPSNYGGSTFVKVFVADSDGGRSTPTEIRVGWDVMGNQPPLLLRDIGVHETLMGQPMILDLEGFARDPDGDDAALVWYPNRSTVDCCQVSLADSQRLIFYPLPGWRAQADEIELFVRDSMGGETWATGIFSWEIPTTTPTPWPTALAPDLSRSEKRAPTAIRQDVELPYLIRIVNSGHALADVTFRDPLPTGVTYVERSAQASYGQINFDSATNSLTWSNGVLARSIAELHFAVLVAPNVKSVTNTATLEDEWGDLVILEATTRVESPLPGPTATASTEPQPAPVYLPLVLKNHPPVYTIAGRVTDGIGAPVAGAAISVSGPVNASTTTASDGRYAFRLPAGTYSVSVSKAGYISPAPRTVTVPPHATNVNFVLRRPTPTQTPVATRTPEPSFGGVLVLDGEDDYAEAEDETELDVGDEAGESLTVEAWVNFQTFGEVEILSKPDAYGLNTYWTSDDLLCLQLTTWSEGQHLGQAHCSRLDTGFWSPGWHHIAGVFDKAANQSTVYMDGEAVYAPDDRCVGEECLPPVVDNSDASLKVGASLTGLIDEARVSDNVRYTGEAYTVPPAPFVCDEHTRALWHFDEPTGATRFHDACGTNNMLIGHNGAHTESVSARAR